MSTVRSGQIWREVPDKGRRIEVLYICKGSGLTVAIQTVVKRRAGDWSRWKGNGKAAGKRQQASIARFNGKSGGYALVEDCGE